jgi:hypothetical protein
MAYFSERLPHVLSRNDLATLLTPTYAEAGSVDDEEGYDRLQRALADEGLLDDLYRSISEALRAQAGPRTEPDALMDKLAKRVGARKGRMKAAPSTPKISAALVRINLILGLAPESMQAVMQTEKGKAALKDGLAALGAHLVGELLK